MPVNEAIHHTACDILVIGSGTAGCCAAIQAGRGGCRTILVEKDEVLGGNSGPHVGVGITGADRYAAHATETGIIHELMEESAWIDAYGVRSGAYTISRRNEAVVQSALQAAGVQVCKRHYARAVEMDGKRIVAVIVEDMAAFRTRRIAVAHVVIDASGDGAVAAAAGAEFAVGSEARATYGERSAPAEATSRVQGSSLVAIAHNVGREVSFVPPPGTPPFLPRLTDGSVRGALCHMHDGYVATLRSGRRDPFFLYMTEQGGDRDTIADDAEIYEDLLRSFWAEWDHLKNGPHAADTRAADILWISPKAGKRESRRFLGDIVLTQADLESGRRFADDIAYGGHNLDEHRILPSGHAEIHGHSIPPLYGIPLRACYSRKVGNLLLAGRLISASHLAASSTRVMRTGGAVGQGVGWAAVLCCRHGCSPRDVATEHVTDLRNGLLRQDASLLDQPLPAAGDLARQATVTASSEQRFNDIDPGVSLPLINRLGCLLFDWRPELRAVEVHVRNAGPAAQALRLRIARSREARMWHPTGHWCRLEPEERPGSSFDQLASVESSVPAGFRGWWRIALPEPLQLAAKDLASDDDLLLISLDANPGLEWSAAERGHELCELWEDRQAAGVWRPLGATGALCLDPPPPLGEAAQVIDGWGRRFGIGPTHHWRAQGPGAQELLLTWAEPQAVGRIELRFDNLPRTMLENPWEHGPHALPGLVRSYALEAELSDGWREVVAVKDNYHRFRVHACAPFTTRRLRLRMAEVHGADVAARVYSIAVYAPGRGGL